MIMFDRTYFLDKILGGNLFYWLTIQRKHLKKSKTQLREQERREEGSREKGGPSENTSLISSLPSLLFSACFAAVSFFCFAAKSSRFNCLASFLSSSL